MRTGNRAQHNRYDCGARQRHAGQPHIILLIVAVAVLGWLIGTMERADARPEWAPHTDGNCFACHPREGAHDFDRLILPCIACHAQRFHARVVQCAGCHVIYSTITTER